MARRRTPARAAIRRGSDPLRASIELSLNAELPVMLVEEKIPIWFTTELARTSSTWHATVNEI